MFGTTGGGVCSPCLPSYLKLESAGMYGRVVSSELPLA
jgi:hypothetical protein